MNDQRFALSLFWRTFILLALLLCGGIFAWVQTLRTLESEPRVVLAAQQIASTVNLVREGMRHADRINRVALVKAMSARETIRVLPREPGDKWAAFETDPFTNRVGGELRSRLGTGAIVASSVNGQPGLWVGFRIDDDPWWLRAEPARINPLTGNTWFVWIGIALLATVIGSVTIARLINRPLRDLSFAASRIRGGEYDSQLDENTLTSEVRAVNMGFNRMARELAKVEANRAVMLAGISHDLRTPLARIRLEAEMSVLDEEARQHIADDIAQLDAIIDKFMDYARPGEIHLIPVHLAILIDKEAATYRDRAEIEIHSRVAIDLKVMADEVEIGRVFANLFENARRYGRNTDSGVAIVNVSYARTGPWVICTVRDSGPGVAPEKLMQLTTPFFRGDVARTAATGAGLGLAIVEKSMQRMGGQLDIQNGPDGGLVTQLRFKRAP